MSPDPEPPAAPPRPVIGVELALVFLLSLAVLLPGIWSYTLVDPWETHYAEVARRMLQDDDLVQTKWSAEGFRSKPVLTFWLMAGSMSALGVGDDGGYSGEMVSSPTVMMAIRLPFVLFGVLGLCACWWMLARMASRRAAWLALLVLGTTPFYLFVARQGITDMTLVGCMIGAIAMFAVASESGDAPAPPLIRLGRRRLVVLDHRHLLALVVGAFLLWQLVYYLAYFIADPRPGPGVRLAGLHPALILGGPMVIGVGLLIAMEVPWRLPRSIAYWIAAAVLVLPLASARVIAASVQRRTGSLAEVPRLTTARQVYLGWFWVFLGVSVLGKGLPAFGVVGVVCAFYVILLGRWRDLLSDRFELVRGFLVVALIAVPWHVAMFLRDGKRFVTEYFIRNLWDRAAVGVHGERGTFDFYLSQVGYGMFLWAALVPAALAALALRSRTDRPEGRARLVIAIWAITSVAFFSLVQTKFHHYILPAVPAFALAIGCWLDDVLAGRARGVGIAALVGIAVLLVITADLMGGQGLWIEMFVYRYDRPWPEAAPWEIDLSDGFLWLGLAGAVALGLLAIPRLRKVGVVALAVAGMAIGMWSMHVYMPIAATHWGMRDAMREYYDRREIHGMRLVYYGARQLADDWGRGDGVRDRFTIRTHVPDNLQEGQPVTFRITVKSVDDKRVEQELVVGGTVIAIDAGEGAVEVSLPASQTAPLAPLIRAGAKQPRAPRGSRRPVRVVDADRLIAWQLYWRGENFWSGDEIWGAIPELKTSFNQYVNKDGKVEVYLADPTLAPTGRRYWVITEGSRGEGIRSALPTPRAQETLRIENQVSNKFTLASFEL